MDCLFTRHGRKLAQEFRERVTAFQVVDQVLEWHARTLKARRSTHNFRVGHDNAISHIYCIVPGLSALGGSLGSWPRDLGRWPLTLGCSPEVRLKERQQRPLATLSAFCNQHWGLVIFSEYVAERSGDFANGG